jgi:hypothetical protein
VAPSLEQELVLVFPNADAIKHALQRVPGENRAEVNTVTFRKIA